MPHDLTRFLCMAAALLVVGWSVSGGAHAQLPGETVTSAESLVDAPRRWQADVQVSDARLYEALQQLVAASRTAARVVEALERSGLPVVIGTPAQLAAMPVSAGGPDATERRVLHAAEAAGHSAEGVSVASVAFRVDAAAAGNGAAGAEARVERVWIAVEVDSVEAWIRRASRGNAELRIRQDLLAILAHEFVAHVGSIAATRRVEDLCDDPTAEQRRRSALARARGEAPPLDGELAACSLRMENRVRRELNASLGWRGTRALPPRHSYSLDVMHFAATRSR
jgi:hypothetical protein